MGWAEGWRTELGRLFRTNAWNLDLLPFYLFIRTNLLRTLSYIMTLIHGTWSIGESHLLQIQADFVLKHCANKL